MTYWLESDTFHDDPRWEVLSGGRPAAIDQLQAAHCRLMSIASDQRHDGYLTAGQVLTGCRRQAVADKLCTAVLGLPPSLHRKGDDCPCLGESWIDGFDFRLHNFLKRNPSRAENDRHKAHKAELRDSRLKQLAYERDGGCCRYCRSGPVSEKAGRARDRRKFRMFDHVDPDKLAGVDAANFVTSCAACNQHKGRRTPDEAEMLLLPAPTPEQAAEWLKRDVEVYDRPAYVRPMHRRDHEQTTDEPPPDHRIDGDPTGDRTSDAIGDPDRDPIDTSTGDVCPEQGEQRSPSPAEWSASYPGRVGEPPTSVVPRSPPTDALGQLPRPPDAPDIYHGRSRSPITGDDP